MAWILIIYAKVYSYVVPINLGAYATRADCQAVAAAVKAHHPEAADFRGAVCIQARGAK